MSEHPSNPPTDRPDLIGRMSAHGAVAAYVLVGLGVISFGAFIFFSLRSGISGHTLFAIWSALLTLIFLGTGIYSWLRPSLQNRMVSDETWMRLQVALVGGLAGFCTALLGLILPFTQPFKTTFVAGLTEWRQHPGYLGLVGGTLFGGLVLMFFSLQVTQQFERSRAEVRRLVYGFNAVLGVLLLFIVLGLVNILGYSNVPPFNSLGKANDWTAARVYSLKASSINSLKSVDRPVKVYVLVSVQSDINRQLLREVTQLMENCRSVNDKFSSEVVSPYLQKERTAELAKKYPIPPGAGYGFVVVYGDEEHAPSQFIPISELFAESADGDFSFRGEGVLIRTLEYLKSGKAKVQIYVTQGEGEPSLADTNPASKKGLGRLAASIKQTNWEIAPLDLAGPRPVIPEDATLVVVAGPRQLSPAAVTALTNYYRGDPQTGRKPGKLLVMLDPIPKDHQFVDSGLEALLTSEGVQLGKDRVLLPNPSNPTLIPAKGNPESRNPLAEAFFFNEDRYVVFGLQGTQSVGSTPSAAQGKVDTFLVPQYACWSEPNPDIDPFAIARQINSNDRAYEKKVRERPVKSLAVAVSDANSRRMIVFGGTDWVRNGMVNELLFESNMDLFRSCVSWLHGLAAIGSRDDDLARTMFKLDKVDKESLPRLEYVPGVVMLLVVVALGISVWVVRRR